MRAGGADTVEADQPPPRPAADLEKAAALKEQALADTGVQALLADREVTGQSVHLKGIARPVQVYRVGLG